MSIIDLYQDFGIQTADEGSKHSRPGWVNTTCPFCVGNPGEHLGAHINSGRFSCWRCGWKPTDKALAKLLGMSTKEVKPLIRKYKVTSSIVSKAPSQNKKIQFKPHRLPSNTGPLEKSHKNYLIKRKFDPDKLEREWGLLGTGPVSFLDQIDYKHRIVAPILWEGGPVSFQARSISSKSTLPYIACPRHREEILHQHILYRQPEEHGEIGICVEGITDAWRFGSKAFAVFGIEYTNQQMRAMSKIFKRIFIVFDDDPQAITQGKWLKEDLKFRGVEVHQEIIQGDPGGMDQDEADYFVKQLIG